MVFGERTMILLELFNQPYSWDVAHDGQYGMVVDFTTDDGERYRVLFDRMTAGELEWKFTDRQMKNAVEGIDEYWEIIFHKGGRVDTLGGIRNPSKVFATVLDVIGQWVEMRNPEVVVFGSLVNEDSRIKLYGRMVRTMQKKFGFGVVAEGVAKDEYVWVLRR